MRTEGGGKGSARRKEMPRTAATTPPSASGRTLPSRGRDGSLFRKPSLDEMGADGAVPAGKTQPKPMFQKPSLDDMGPGTDMAKPAGAVSRSLFRKQSAAEAHGSDFGIPDDGRPSLFRKNSLDEMTVRRTEKPFEGSKPSKPDLPSPLSWGEGGPEGRLRGGTDDRNAGNSAKPLKRERPGIGSYENPSDQRQQKRRPGKTGRPGR